MTISDIKSIIDSKYFPTNQTKLVEFDKAKGVIITETKIDSALINELLVCRLDPNAERIFPYFRQKTGLGLNQICDYFLFAMQQNSLFILLVELKQGHCCATPQLQASECFMQFLKHTAERVGFDTTNISVIKVKYHQHAKRGTKQAAPIIENGIVLYPWLQFRIDAIINVCKEHHLI